MMDPIVPDYSGACISNVVPALLEGKAVDWMPSELDIGGPTCLLVLDGLGWNTFVEHRGVLPNLASLSSAEIRSVVPSSTASALTSVTTGLTPAEHGLVGYRMRVAGQLLNVLGWMHPDGGPPPEPDEVQPEMAFLGRPVRVVTRAEFLKTGYSLASMRGAQLIGWRVTSTLVEHCRRLASASAEFFYAYYDGIDQVAHRFGLESEFFLAELKAADRLVGDLLDALPSNRTLVVVSDHGQVHVGKNGWLSTEGCAEYTAFYSGDGRFRYLHAHPGAEKDLVSAAEETLGASGWVLSRERLLDEGWLGATPAKWVLPRLGDVTLAARDPIAYIDPTNLRETNLISAHGSLTAQEMLVPLLAGPGRG